MKKFLAVIVALVILSFYLPYRKGGGDSAFAETFGITNKSDWWKMIIIWAVIFIGGAFVYETFRDKK